MTDEAIGLLATSAGWRAFDPAKVKACVNKRMPPRPKLPPGVLSLVLERSTFWKPGQTLSVEFLAGTARTQQRVLETMKEWSKYASVFFEPAGRGQSGNIRVAFNAGQGSWSYIGTGALQIPAGQETMNLGWIDDSTDDVEVRRVVLHETGHAIGCEHEQSSPVEAIPWNYSATYAYYESTQGWSRQDVDEQVFAKLTEAETLHTRFDPTSIMEYPVPAELTTDGSAIGWNTDLDDLDKQFIATVYPSAGQPPVTPGGPPVVPPAPPAPPPTPPAPYPLVSVGLAAAKAPIPAWGQPAKFTLDIGSTDPFTLAVEPDRGSVPGREPGVIIRNAGGKDFKVVTRNHRGHVSGPAGRYTLYCWHPNPLGSGLMWAKCIAGAADVSRLD